MSSKKRRGTSNIVILIGLLVILFATNPNEDKLKQFVKEDYKQAMSEGNNVSDAIKEIAASPAAWLSSLSNERNNYYIFSIYKITLFDGEHTYLGVVNHFIEIPD